MEELGNIPTSHCAMVYSEIGNEELMGLKRDKRRALTSNALQCLVSDQCFCFVFSHLHSIEATILDVQ